MRKRILLGYSNCDCEDRGDLCFTITNDVVTSADTTWISDVPSGITLEIGGKITSIADGGFRSCSGLTDVIIGDNVDSIGTHAFSGCTGLTSVAIGSGITSIGDYDFYGATGLTSITINATTPPVMGTSTFNKNANFSIYVPSESVNIYKLSYDWSQFANRIYPIP